MPDLYRVREEQKRQHKGAGHLDVLRLEQHLLSIQAVSKDTTHQRKEHDRQLSQEKVQTQIKRVPGEIVNQPALRELLHKRADGGNAGSYPHDAKVAIPERPEYAFKELRWFGHWSTLDWRTGKEGQAGCFLVFRW